MQLANKSIFKKNILGTLSFEEWRTQIKTHLLGNKSLHKGEAFKCSECSYERNPKSQSNGTSNEVEIYKCTECSYESKRKWSLNKHLGVHERTNELENLVNAVINTENIHELKEQRNINVLSEYYLNRVKPFKCPECPYKTKNKSHLNSHLLRHKNRNEVELFKCKECSFETKYKTILRKHST